MTRLQCMLQECKNLCPDYLHLIHFISFLISSMLPPVSLISLVQFYSPPTCKRTKACYTFTVSQCQIVEKNFVSRLLLTYPHNVVKRDYHRIIVVANTSKVIQSNYLLDMPVNSLDHGTTCTLFLNSLGMVTP